MFIYPEEWNIFLHLMLKQYPTLGCCGLDCGMCPTYYTDGSSRCPGCCGKDFFEKHPSCSFITCCVRKRNLEVCAQCGEFPCAKFDNATEGPDFKTTAKRILANQYYIKDFGIDNFLEQQAERMRVLREMLACCNDGRSKTFYCLAATLLSLNSIKEALKRAEQEIINKSVSENDLKGRAKILKSILNQVAEEENEELKMRKK